MKKIATTLVLIGLSINVAQATWCGYNEFLGRTNNVTTQSAIWNQANICGSGGGPQDVLTMSSQDGSRTCQVSRGALSNNLYNIANVICKKPDPDSAKICTGAFQALTVMDPTTLKNNPAYESIFGCKNADEQ